jgi:hypothetical protein
MSSLIAGRAHARVYRTSGKADVVASARRALERSGGTVLFESGATRAPTYFGVQLDGDERLGALAYLFRATRVVTRRRPADENKLQIRYGSEPSWHLEEHALGFDVAGVDVTAVLGVHRDADVLIALDPARYDPLPMGISIEFKDAAVYAALKDGWHVWQRDTIPGVQREARTTEGFDTLIALRPERLIDLLRFEREASALGLDPSLRYRAALAVGSGSGGLGSSSARYRLKRDFELSSNEILDIISRQGRLAVAVRGGVAEHHLGRRLAADPDVAHSTPIDRDGGDFKVHLTDGQSLLIECKNAAPTSYSDGAWKVEVQKTRASKTDPASRFYRATQFDVVAACLFSSTGRWDFRYRHTRDLRRHDRFGDRLAAVQRIDDSWSTSLAGALRS